MTERQLRILKTLEGMLVIEQVKHASPDSEIGAIADSLRREIREINDISSAQRRNRRSRWLGVVRGRLDTIRTEQMLPLSRLACRIFAGEMAIEAALAVPHKRAPTENILAAADRIIDTLKPHKELLRESHIDPVRLDRLAAAIAEIRESLSSATVKVADRAVPTRRIAELFRAARRDVDVLSVLCGTVPATAGEKGYLKSAFRIPKKTGRPRAKTARRAKGTADIGVAGGSPP